jgi:hypothetical protein
MTHTSNINVITVSLEDLFAMISSLICPTDKILPSTQNIPEKFVFGSIDKINLPAH